MKKNQKRKCFGGDGSTVIEGSPQFILWLIDCMGKCISDSPNIDKAYAYAHLISEYLRLELKAQGDSDDDISVLEKRAELEIDLILKNASNPANNLEKLQVKNMTT